MLRGWLLFGGALLCAACASGESAPLPAPVTAAPSDPGASEHQGSSGDSSSAGDSTTEDTAAAAPGSDPCEAMLAFLSELGCGVLKLWCGAASAVTIGHAKIPCDLAVSFACDVADDAAAAMAQLCGTP